MSNTISSMIGMKLKDAIKLDTVPLNKTYPKKAYYLKLVYTDIYISLANNIEIKKEEQQTLSGAKIRIS